MLRKALLCAALVALLPAAASAQKPIVAGIGPHVGFGVDPDQLLLGGQAIIGEIAPNLTFDPGLELGFGDDQTIISLNFDLHYHFALSNSSWRPYVGAGMGIHFVQFDAPPGFEDDNDTDVGGDFIVGAGAPTASGNRFFTELKFGLGDGYSLRGLVGWNFKV
jgi:hypothetical protein